ncbi:protein-glutamate O-methyltransferase CheR [Lysinibacillus sp. FSL M8-0216]|uniref:Chemotaxis protein methyltransferase CheR n=1 Tax=Lysinibacillus fusiformis TaxID=28031 RepID=A0A1H9L2X2_9BACI|nr:MULTISPECIES: protein-glutamate O-methyltransferase CheR [Lysinibacillus]MED4671976.1 protein-glutamate O-methyltransferase CheR [Lysinibacillus fusiformis]NOG29394.1 protein-glutamate O-methyltransferase CheR [Lysinibacillus fusiformis]QAS58022.1 protein-glutamate O-methyltransferase CheR [Lysinibacillus sphaericus]RDV31320.1 protein-glutamate O-methyltransferase CheR [Lysinibacillus fusiformis]SCX60627.1 chemotaxis protein methyltransferase CheR [Lysinibacillus fusiformis]
MEHFEPLEQNIQLNKQTNLEIDLLLEAIYRLSGYDFRQYNRSSISRRIFNRMRINSIPTISRVQEKVIHEQEFLEQLLNDFSINVTEMFRNPSFFKAFREKVIPALREYQEIRIWHAGCATGEEVYSMAILLQEEGLIDKAVIYATDMNEQVLEKAKKGVFPIHKMQAYTKNYMLAGGAHAFSEYYKTDYQYAYFHPTLLKNIIFAQHNLVTDQSFNEFHVVLCRNVLIYFSPQLQSQVHHLFYESLSDKGFLCLGDKETLRFEEVISNYREVVGNERIYQKID